jgi:hypothetical protein
MGTVRFVNPFVNGAAQVFEKPAEYAGIDFTDLIPGMKMNGGCMH